MSDRESLLLALVVLHLLEGVLWLSHGTLLFRRDLRRRLGWVQPGATVGNRRGGFVFVSPLPPFTGVFAAKPLPLAISVEGVAAFQTEVLPGTTTLQRSGRSIGWAMLKDVHADERKLRLNGDVFFEGDSVHQAHELAKLLRQLSVAGDGNRPALIRAVIEERLDLEGLRKTLADFDQSTSFLRTASLVLTVFLLILCPLTVWRFGWMPALWFILPMLLLHTAHDSLQNSSERCAMRQHFQDMIAGLFALLGLLAVSGITNQPAPDSYDVKDGGSDNDAADQQQGQR